MSDIEKGCIFNHRDGFPEQELFEVKQERDRLKAELESAEKEIYRLRDDRDRLKVELETERRNLERYKIALAAAMKERDFWKKKCEETGDK